MEDIQSFLSSKRRNSHVQDKLKVLEENFYRKASIFKSLVPGKNNKLKQQAYFGLLLLNRIPKFKTDEDIAIWQRPYVEVDSRRYFELKRCWQDINQSSSGLEPLLEIYLGAELANIAYRAILNVPTLAYQRGYNRRSYRSSDLEDLYLKLSFNLIIDLFYEATYDFDLEEYLIYANQIAIPNFAHLVAAAVESKGPPFKNFCLASINGDHPKAKPSRTIIKGMLLSSDPELWAAVGKLLIAAQRQEGLRQTILECLDDTHIGAMKYFIALILEHDLLRFSSVVRAVDIWVGLAWEDRKVKSMEAHLTFAHHFLEHPETILKGIESANNIEVYMALWAQAVFDVSKCNTLLDSVLKGNVEKQTLALLFVSEVKLTNFSLFYGQLFIDHPEPLLHCFAARILNFDQIHSYLPYEKRLAIFKLLEGMLAKLPAKSSLIEGKVFSWTSFTVGQSEVMALMINLLDLSLESDQRLIVPYFELLELGFRERICGRILITFDPFSDKEIDNNPTTYQKYFALKVISDRSTAIRDRAIKALKHASLEDSEIVVLEKMLSRKSASLRANILALLQRGSLEQIKGSIERLVTATNPEQRIAGLDLVIQLRKKESREENWIQSIVANYGNGHILNTKEQSMLAAIEPQVLKHAYSPSNGFGLYDPEQANSIAILPKVLSGELARLSKNNIYGFSINISKLEEEMEALHDLYLAHKDFEYPIRISETDTEDVLLGNQFRPIANFSKDKIKAADQILSYPLGEKWLEWYAKSTLQSSDLFLLLLSWHDSGQNQARILFSDHFSKQIEASYLIGFKRLKLAFNRDPLLEIIQNLALRFPYEKETDYLSDYFVSFFSSASPSAINRLISTSEDSFSQQFTWRDIPCFTQRWAYYKLKSWSLDEIGFKCYWSLILWVYQNHPPKTKPFLPPLVDYLRAYEYGLIGEGFLIKRLLMPDALQVLSRNFGSFEINLKKRFPFCVEIAQKCQGRIIEIELLRGESPSPVSDLAPQIQLLYGSSYFVQILRALGKDKLHRGYIYGNNRQFNRQEILSTFLKRCQPSKEDNAKEFKRRLDEAGISEKRLIEAATYAQQWLPLVASYLDYPQLESAVWWLHAHTNCELTSQAESEIAKHSPLPIESFIEGAVDIDWFKRVYKLLGAAKWKTLYDSAKYISDGNGHRRAMLYADVILGKTKITELRERISASRNQDYLRVYPLVPLSAKSADMDVLKRYQFIQKFKKESKEFGAQKQGSEAIAIRIAMENLARTALYSDPLRLEWAMEIKETITIISQANKVKLEEDLSLWLEIDANGKAEIGSFRADKKLKSIPSKYRKHKEVLKLKEDLKKLREQYRRTLKSLDLAMVNGDVFPASEIEQLMDHPVVAPMLKKLVIWSDGFLGFWQDGQLLQANGSLMRLGKENRIAHVVDLNNSKLWPEFQSYCFEKQIVQPFKQVFRELYVPTEDELRQSTYSMRYAGHQIQPSKAAALLKSRNWTVDYEEGLQKVLHPQNLVIQMIAPANWYSPADVEAPSIDKVVFSRRFGTQDLALKDVEPRSFSEAMRDIDLVVSVAHVGEGNPEISLSTMELRALLLKESLKLFKINNVNLSERHAIIKGTLGDYSVHLGSGICHKIAGAQMPIITIHSQHRGPLFLPFLDDDPRSAEIISKVLLLAKDDKIKDPTILKLIR